MDRRTFLLSAGLVAATPLLPELGDAAAWAAAPSPSTWYGVVPRPITGQGLGDWIAHEDARFAPAHKRLGVVHIEVPEIKPFPANVFNRNVVYSFEQLPTVSDFTDWLREWHRGTDHAPRPYILHWNYKHEIDHLVHKGYSLTQYKADLKKLLDAAAATKLPRLRATQILMGYSFNPAVRRQYLPPSAFWVNGITHLLVDLDGEGHHHNAQYPTFSSSLPHVPGYARARRVPWGVGEFGAFRAANDPNGTRRAQWIRTMTPQFVRLGANMVCFFDTQKNITGGTEPLTKPAEIAAWRSFVARSAL